MLGIHGHRASQKMDSNLFRRNGFGLKNRQVDGEDTIQVLDTTIWHHLAMRIETPTSIQQQPQKFGSNVRGNYIISLSRNFILE